MFKHVLVIIGLVFAGLAAWPAWSDGAAGPTPAPAQAPSAATRGRARADQRLAAPLGCRAAFSPPLAHSLLGAFVFARGAAPAGRPAGRLAGARPCQCAAAPGATRALPGATPGGSR